MDDADRFGDDWLDGSRPTGIEKAWRLVESELPSGWTVSGVQRLRGPYEWMATASGPGAKGLNGYAEHPAAALLDLHDRLREQKSEALRKKLPKPF